MPVNVPITQFGIENVTKAYLAVKTSALMVAPQAFASFIGLAIVFHRARKTWLANVDQHGMSDAKVIFDLLWQYIFTAAIIVAAPFLFRAFESILEGLQQAAINALGGEPKGATSTMITEIDEMNKKYPDGPSFMWDTLPDILAYFYVLYLKPPLALIVRYLYALFLAGRYLHLLLLELVFPVAFVCVLSEDTSKYFYTWVTQMFINYLKIPAFLIANAIADNAIITLFDDPYTLIGILAQFSLKLYLLKRAEEYVQKLI